MRDITIFQLTVKRTLKNLKEQGKQKSPSEEEIQLLEKLSTSKQEAIRTAIATYGYFRKEPVSEKGKNAFESYIKGHFRNVVEALIEEDAPEKLACLEEKGWMNDSLVDEFIKTAREREKIQAMLYLMMLKQEKYGYRQQSFEL